MEQVVDVMYCVILNSRILYRFYCATKGALLWYNKKRRRRSKPNDSLTLTAGCLLTSSPSEEPPTTTALGMIRCDVRRERSSEDAALIFCRLVPVLINLDVSGVDLFSYHVSIL